VNPDHLFLGTALDNNLDTRAKGKAPWQIQGKKWAEWARGSNHWSAKHPENIQKGEQCGRAKLTEKDVLEIRTRFANGGVSKVQLAKEYPVTPEMVGKIVNGKAWRYLWASP
jgi:hypothetical protein